MGIICSECGRDIDKIHQDNMSSSINYNLCEDCFYGKCRQYVQTFPCRSCGNYFDGDNMYENNGRLYCGDCFEILMEATDNEN